MTTLRELYIKYRQETCLFQNLHKSLLTQLENILHHEVTSYHNDLEISYLGPIGITIINKKTDDPLYMLTCFSLNDIWNITIDKENWQEGALPAKFIKNGVDEKVILQLILNEYNINTEILTTSQNVSDKLESEKLESEKLESEKHDLFIVDGSIDDTMRGISFTLGIYDSFNMAQQELINFIKDYEYEMYNDAYLVSTGKFHFSIGITKEKINKTNHNVFNRI